MFKFIIGFFSGVCYLALYASENPDFILIKVGTLIKAIFLGWKGWMVMWKKLAGAILFETASYGLKQYKSKKRKSTRKPTSKRKTTKRGK